MSEQYTDSERLAARLDRVLPPGQTFTPPPSGDPLVNTAAYIAQMPVPPLSAEAVRRIETRMMSAFDHLHPRVIRRQSFNVWRWAAAACIAFFLFAGGVTTSAARSVPGDPLYGVKQWIEQVELGTAFSPAAKASVYLAHAERRAQEALLLLNRDESAASLLTAARANLAAARDSLSAELLDAGESARINDRAAQIAEFIERVETAESATINPESALPLATEATDTPSPTATSTGTSTSTAAPTMTPTIRASSTITPSSSPTATRTPRPTRTPTHTRTPRLRATETNLPLLPTSTPVQLPPPSDGENPQPLPTSAPENQGINPATDCPGNSCNSAGVPGGQVNPESPPGQSGGRDDNPPAPPGQENPRGGRP